MLEQMQTTTIEAHGEGPSPVQILVQFLQFRPEQVQEFAQLLQARQAAVPPLVNEEIKVKGQPAISVEMKFARHGPLIYVEKDKNRAFAARTTG